MATLQRPRRSLARGYLSRGFFIGAPPNGAPARPPNADGGAGHVAIPVPFPRPPVRTPITQHCYTDTAQCWRYRVSKPFRICTATLARSGHRLLLRANQQPCASAAPPSKLVVVTEACVSAFREIFKRSSRSPLLCARRSCLTLSFFFPTCRPLSYINIPRRRRRTPR